MDFHGMSHVKASRYTCTVTKGIDVFLDVFVLPLPNTLLLMLFRYFPWCFAGALADTFPFYTFLDNFLDAFTYYPYKYLYGKTAAFT